MLHIQVTAGRRAIADEDPLRVDSRYAHDTYRDDIPGGRLPDLNPGWRHPGCRAGQLSRGRGATCIPAIPLPPPARAGSGSLPIRPRGSEAEALSGGVTGLRRGGEPASSTGRLRHLERGADPSGTERRTFLPRGVAAFAGTLPTESPGPSGATSLGTPA